MAMEGEMGRLLRGKGNKQAGHQGGLFDLPDQMKRLSQGGDPLEALSRAVDFEVFRDVLNDAMGYGDGAKGGRPPFDPVMMFKVLLLQAQNDVSDARAEFWIKDRQIAY
jgi:transposase, IS5 family